MVNKFYRPGIIYGTHRDTENFAYELGMRISMGKLKDKLTVVENSAWKEGSNYVDVARRLLTHIKAGLPISDFTHDMISLPAYKKWQDSVYPSIGPFVFDLHNAHPNSGSDEMKFALRNDTGISQKEHFMKLADDLQHAYKTPIEVGEGESFCSVCEIYLPANVQVSEKNRSKQLINLENELDAQLTDKMRLDLVTRFGHGIAKFYDKFSYKNANPGKPEYIAMQERDQALFEELFSKVLEKKW